MKTNRLSTPLTLKRGPALRNRFALAPMTNQQSRADGCLSDDEYRWLTMRAAGGFGLTMTCASHVQAVGQGFAGQLGTFGDEHVPGLARLAKGIRDNGSVSSLQLHHAGIRAPRELVQQPVGPSDDAGTGARALSLAEVGQLRDDFISAARRAESAGFDGVEVHGAHGYVLTQFLSPETNRREDRYGGSLENRTRLLLEIIDGIRRQCRPDFQIGLRLSPERFGIRLEEARLLAAQVLEEGTIDYLDMSMWDAFKEPEEEGFRGRSLLSYFTELTRGAVRLGAAGKITSGADAARLIDAGCDFALIGKSAILRHDFPKRVLQDPNYRPPALPVSQRYLANEGLGPTFIAYMQGWAGFVSDDGSA